MLDEIGVDNGIEQVVVDGIVHVVVHVVVAPPGPVLEVELVVVTCAGFE